MQQGATPSFAPAISSNEAVSAQTAPPSAPTNVSPEPAPFDAAAFSNHLKSFGPDWTPENWQEKVKTLHASNSRLGRENSEFKGKLKQFEPWEQAMRNDPGFEEHVANSVRDYYQNRQPGYQSMNPQQLGPQPLLNQNPALEQRLSALEHDTRIGKLVNDLEVLKQRGMPVTEMMQDEIVQKAVDTNYSFTTEQYYMAMYGPQIMELKAQEAQRAAVAAIQQNNGVYRQPPSGGTAPIATAPAVPAYGTPEYNAYAEKRVAELLPNGLRGLIRATSNNR